MNETINDLIERGIAIREQRIAEERAWQIAEETRRAQERAEAECAIRNLLPPAIADMVEMEIMEPYYDYAYIRVSQPFPKEGSIKICAKKNRGSWSLIAYDATNPNGYSLRLPTLEEAVAYAAGVLEI